MTAPVLQLPPACSGSVLNAAVTAATRALEEQGEVRLEVSLPGGRSAGRHSHASDLLHDVRDALTPLIEDAHRPIGSGRSCDLRAAVPRAPVEIEGAVSWLRLGVGRFVPDLQPMDSGVYRNIAVLRVRSSLFNVPVILTSDLHRDAGDVMGWVASRLDDPSRWTVLACGDMAGTSSFQQDAGPTPAYRGMLDDFGKVYFVLGNHDVPDDALLGLTNADGSRCHLDADGAPSVAQVGGRRVVGVSGIIGKPTRPRRRTAGDFSAQVDRAVRAAGPQGILLTHETPAVPGFEPSFGWRELTEAVRTARPLAHVWGHCHLSPVALADRGILHICTDARVLLVEPDT